MADSCPVLSPEQRQYLDIQSRAEEEMLATVLRAIDEAAARAAERLAQAGNTERPPAAEYFAAVVHQKLFLKLCGADLDTMKGGDPYIAFRLLDNGRNISEHYWGMLPEEAGRLADDEDGGSR